MSPQNGTLTTGQVLQNRYRVVSPLKRGGMGAVYRAWDTRLNVPVALKEMTPQPGLDPRTLAQLRQQFQQEATTLARLDHPNLVDVTDFFEEGGNAYLVMKLIEGESLAERIERQGALPEAQVLTWADHLLDALAHCHSQGVLHRDVKPQNVIIRPDGRAVLVDFGLVKLWDPSDPHTQTAIRSMGTPEYAPPEQYDAAAGHTDPRSDIYSLGATLYHALAGHAPPTATQRIVDPAALAPVQATNPQVSPYLERALMKALALQPDARFQSTAEMRMALRGTMPIAPQLRRPTTGTQVVTSPAPPVKRRTIPWVWIGLAVGMTGVVMVLVGGVILRATGILDGPSPSPQAASQVLTTPTSGTMSEAALATTEATATPVPPAEAATSTLPPTSPPRQPTATRQPTSTSEPTATPHPTSTPVPTDTPTPSCPAVTGPFASLWEAMQEQLGCAVNQPYTIWMAEESFERGRMLWREDTDSMSVLYNDGSWASYQDIWQEGDPDYSCPESAPTESPPTPIRGFGKIWCTYSTVRDGLGWATNSERGDNATVQKFESGSILRTDAGTTYILYTSGAWEQRR
jgi:serine/threonine protein kinase